MCCSPFQNDLCCFDVGSEKHERLCFRIEHKRKRCCCEDLWATCVLIAQGHQQQEGCDQLFLIQVYQCLGLLSVVSYAPVSTLHLRTWLGGSNKQWVCLNWSFYCCDQTPRPKVTWEEKALSHLILIS